MRGNEFERKVQEQMDELHLRPSPSVWMEVEKELKKKKRRRIVVFLSMLAGIGLLGYTGYTFISQGSKPVANQEKETILRADQPSDHSSITQNGSSTSNTNNTNNNTTTIDQSLLNQTNNTSTSNTSTSNTTTNNTTQLSDQSPDRSISRSVNNPQPGQPVSGTQGQIYPQSAPPSSNRNGQLIVRQTNPAIGKRTQERPVEDKTDIAKTDITNDTRITDLQDTPESTSIKKDSAIAKVDLTAAPAESTTPDPVVAKKKQGKKPTVRFGFELSAGKNLSRNNSFKIPSRSILYERFNSQLTSFFDSSNALAQSQNPPQSGSNSGLGAVWGSGFVRMPSAIKAGLAFKVGVNAEINLTKRSSILTGIRYTYLSESTVIGETGYASNLPINRLVYDGTVSYWNNSYGASNPTRSAYYSGAYYFGPQLKEYTNKYHFIELPLSYQLQVISGKKIQLLWNGGVSASLLVRTNALVYDTAAYGVYYKNDRAHNKAHFAFNSALAVRFGQEKKMQWSIGPEFSMDMTHVLKQDFILRNRYFMYGGVTARVLFPGKKIK